MSGSECMIAASSPPQKVRRLRKVGLIIGRGEGRGGGGGIVVSSRNVAEDSEQGAFITVDMRCLNRVTGTISNS